MKQKLKNILAVESSENRLHSSQMLFSINSGKQTKMEGLIALCFSCKHKWFPRKKGSDLLQLCFHRSNANSMCFCVENKGD